MFKVCSLALALASLPASCLVRAAGGEGGSELGAHGGVDGAGQRHLVFLHAEASSEGGGTEENCETKHSLAGSEEVEQIPGLYCILGPAQVLLPMVRHILTAEWRYILTSV